ncbi:MAG: branched-chain amino acid transporter permease [Acutalibacteraceae bacterium]
MNNVHAVLTIAIMSAVTLLLRVIPFVIFSGKRKLPAFITYLGTVLPYAIMGMLVVYCLKDTSFAAVSGFLPQFIAGAIVVLTYVFKRNTLISIISGTVSYMLLVQLVF